MINAKKLAAYTHQARSNYTGALYHYANEETVPLILTQKGVSFRMTRIDDFEDKHEGKTIEIYYNLALERLQKMNLFSEECMQSLSAVTPSDKYAFLFSSSASKFICPEEPIPYVICFSKKANDPYMFKNYLKTTNRGCCIGFRENFWHSHPTQTKQVGLSKIGYDFCLLDVLYGEAIVDELVNYIIGLFDTCDGDATIDDVNNWLIPCLEKKLLYMKFCSKLSKYRDENEARLVLLIAKSEINSTNRPRMFQAHEQNGKHYLYITFPHNVLKCVHPSEALAGDMDELRTIIKTNGYPL